MKCFIFKSVWRRIRDRLTFSWSEPRKHKKNSGVHPASVQFAVIESHLTMTHFSSGIKEAY